jgi:3-oxoadipate enol-lactonase
MVTTIDQNKFLEINGVNICYNDTDENKTALIFIHGFPFDQSMWKQQRDFFKKNFRVITYDIRGYGKSTNAGVASMNQYADDLVAIIDELKLNKVIACGLSMGGYVLLNAFSRYPGKFEALILADTQCIADSPEGIEKRKSAIRLIEDKGLTDYAQSFVGNVFSHESLINKIEAVESIRNVILSTQQITITGTLEALAQRSETCFVLPKIKIPVLIICGKEDVVTPVKQSEFLNANIANSKLRIIEKAGHLSNLEQPYEFNRQILDFIVDR